MRIGLKIASIVILFVIFAFVFPEDKQVIVINASHGGKDTGIVHDKVNEKDVVLDIAKMIKSSISDDNTSIILIRDEDNYVSLDDRLNKINELKADLVLTLHVNHAQNETINGVEAYVCNQSDNYSESVRVADQLIEHVAGTTPLLYNGIKSSGFKILKESNSPSVHVELGYLSNSADRELLTDKKGREALAMSIASYLEKIK